MTSGVAIRAVFVACVAVYPLAVYFGLQYFPPAFFGIVLAVLLALRFGVLRPDERTVLLPILLLFFAYAVTTAVLASQTMLLLYPCAVNFSLAAIFLTSLRSPEPLLLRIVRARGMPISVHGPMYLRRLTAVWAGFFVVNGLVALWTTRLSIEAWTLYNGLIAYIIVGVFAAGEFVFRGYYKKRKGV